MTKTGFIGLGNIGKPMAINLTNKGPASGLDVMVYDVVDAPIQELIGLGAKGASTPKEMASECEIIGLCVRDDNDVEALLYGEEGLLENMSPDAIIAIHSTVKRVNVLRWCKDAAEKQIHLIDAPISGTTGASSALEGTLCYMVGGDEAVVKRCEPVFETAAAKIVHTGPVGSGIVYKCANNLISFTAFVAVAEAVALLDSYDLDASILYNDIASANGVLTPSQHTFISGREAIAAECTAEDMQAFFGPPGELGIKDLGLALELAEQSGIDLPTTSTAKSRVIAAFLKSDAK